MKQTIKVNIRSIGDTWQVSTNRGVTWTHKMKYNSNLDISRNAMIASVASSMLTSTIASHLAHCGKNDLTYELTVISE